MHTSSVSYYVGKRIRRVWNGSVFGRFPGTDLIRLTNISDGAKSLKRSIIGPNSYGSYKKKAKDENLTETTCAGSAWKCIGASQ